MLRVRYVALNIKLDPDEKYSEFSSHESVNWICILNLKIKIIYIFMHYILLFIRRIENRKWNILTLLFTIIPMIRNVLEIGIATSRWKLFIAIWFSFIWEQEQKQRNIIIIFRLVVI